MRRISNPNYVKFGPAEMFVSFAKDRGDLRTNDSGQFFYRELADGRFTCASPELGRQLIDAGVRAGEQVGITRKTYNRCAIWTVRPIDQVAQMPREVPTTRKAKPTAHELPERLFAKPEPPNRDGQPVAQAPAPVFPECVPATNGTALTEPLKVDSPTLITRCMLAAVDAAAKATAHGQEIGFPVTFGAPEIEAIAVTLYINASGPSGYRMPNNQARSHYNGNSGKGVRQEGSRQ
jgi:hypothetical protein